MLSMVRARYYQTLGFPVVEWPLVRVCMGILGTTNSVVGTKREPIIYPPLQKPHTRNTFIKAQTRHVYSFELSLCLLMIAIVTRWPVLL